MTKHIYEVIDASNNQHRQTELPVSVQCFDSLADSAHRDLGSLKAITGKSRATIYRWVDQGILPAPKKLGATRNFWTAGVIRRALGI